MATNLQYVGGAAAILGLVAMASDVEGLYAAVKALVCVVKSNPLASKEMERIKGYQVAVTLALGQLVCLHSVVFLEKITGEKLGSSRSCWRCC